MLCAEIGVTQDTRADHAQYLAQWLKLCAAPHKSSNHEVSVMRSCARAALIFL